MGKISDVLDKYKKEQTINAERILPRVPESPSTLRSIAQKDMNPKLVTLSAPDSVDAENFKILRSQILFPKEGKRPKTIMVTSTFPGEGKTFVASNLAVSIALGIDEYVLLLDCDLRRPHIHVMFGFKNKQGLHECLTNKKPLPDLIVRTSIDKLSLLPAGSIPSNPTELLSSSTMKSFLEEVGSRYKDRFIVIDSTPIQVTAETNVLANFVDGIILVVMAQRAPKEDVKKAVEKLGTEKIIGMVFNGYERAHKGYYKYYDRYYKQ